MPAALSFSRQTRRTFAVGACTLIVPAALVFSGLGFLRAHNAGAAAVRGLPEVSSLLGATGATEVCDGRSLCFEFATAQDGPLWVLLQNRPGAGVRGVLVSRTPGFEDYQTLRAGSESEASLLAALRNLATRAGADDQPRVQGNLEHLCDLISRRQHPCPPPATWYLY